MKKTTHGCVALLMLATSAFSVADPLSEEIDRLQPIFSRIGLQGTQAENIARHYLQQPDGRCAKVAASALRGDNSAKSELRRFPGYCAWHSEAKTEVTSAPASTPTSARAPKPIPAPTATATTKSAVTDDGLAHEQFCSIDLPSDAIEKSTGKQRTILSRNGGAQTVYVIHENGVSKNLADARAMVGNLLDAIGDRRVSVDFEHRQRDRFILRGKINGNQYFFVKTIQTGSFTCGVIFAADKSTTQGSSDEIEMMMTLHISKVPNHKLSSIEKAENSLGDVATHKWDLPNNIAHVIFLNDLCQGDRGEMSAFFVRDKKTERLCYTDMKTRPGYIKMCSIEVNSPCVEIEKSMLTPLGNNLPM